MSTTSYQSSENVLFLVGPRPDRVATLVNVANPHWVDACLDIMDWYSEMWGGCANVVVPTDGKSIDKAFLRLLREYDPDTVHVYPGADEDGFAVDNGLEELLLSRLNPFPRGRILHVSPTSRPGFHSLLVDILPFWKEPPPQVARLTFDGRPEERLLLYSAIGSTGSLELSIGCREREFEDAVRGKSLLVDEAEGRRRRWALQKLVVRDVGVVNHPSASTLSEVAVKSALGAGTRALLDILGLRSPGGTETPFIPPSSISLPFQVGQMALTASGPRKPLASPEIVAVVGDTISDFCGYTLLRGLCRYAVWLPRFLNPDWGSQIRDFDHSLSTAGLPLGDPDVILTSYSLTADEMRGLTDEASQVPWHRLDYSYQEPHLLDVRSSMFMETGTTHEFVNVVDGITERILPMPVPEHFEPSADVHWVGEFDISGWAVPRRAEVAGLILHDYTPPVSEQVRVTPRGFALQSAATLTLGRIVAYNIRRSRVQIPTAWASFEELFKSAGYSMRLTHNSAYLRGTVESLGGIDKAAEVCRSEQEYAVIQVCLNDGDNQPGIYDEGIRLADPDVRYLRRKYLNVETIGKRLGDKTGTFLDRMCSSGVLQRGFVLRCGTCHKPEWYSIEDVGLQFVCRFCGTAQKISHVSLTHQKTQEEPAWFYRLNEIVHQAFRNNAQVPILALATLKGRSQRGFDHVSEVCFSKGTAVATDAPELDICCITDGDVVLVECSTVGNYEKPRADVRAALARDLRADRFVFATTDAEWGRGTIENVEGVFMGSGCEVEWMTRSHLIPGG